MLHINVNLPIIKHVNQQIENATTQIGLPLALEAGHHHIATPTFTLAHYGDKTVEASLHIDYDFDATDKTLVFVGDHDMLPASISLLVWNEATPDEKKTICATKDYSDSGASDLVNKSVYAQIQHSLSDAQKNLMTAAMDTVTAIHTIDKAPEVTEENYQALEGILPKHLEGAYQAAPKDGKIAMLGHMVRSTYGGTKNFAVNAAFSNVQGSTGDPKPSGFSSWVALWEAATKTTANICTSYDIVDGSADPGFCNHTLVGGHIIPGKTAMPVATGGTVLLIPICGRHNNPSHDAEYMVANRYQTAVILNHYHQ